MLSSTPSFYVNTCKMLTEMSNGGGDPSIERGFVDLSPGQMQVLVKGYLGGIGDFVGDVASLVGGDIDIRRLPVINGILSKTGHEQEEMRINSRWYRLRDKMEEMKNTIKKYQKKEDAGDASWMSKRISLEDKWGDALEEWKDYSDEIKRLQDILKDPASEEEAAEATAEINRLKQEAVKRLGGMK